MAYIGKTPTIGNFQKCDAITVVNGQAAYTMQVGGTNVSPESENHMLVSLNGILQAPVDSFTISGSTITFASNLATGDVIDFIMLLGNVLDLGVPSDNTVSLAKLTATGTKDATTFLRGDNTFAEAGGKFESQLFHTVHETADGSSGGTATSGSWQTGTLNTIKTNEITSASLSSNTISLPAGNYFVQANMFLSNIAYAQTRLYNTSDASTLVIGDNIYTEGYAGGCSHCIGRFTLSGTKNIEFQYYVQTTYATSGQGFANPTTGEVNRFKNVQIWKI